MDQEHGYRVSASGSNRNKLVQPEDSTEESEVGTIHFLVGGKMRLLRAAEFLKHQSAHDVEADLLSNSLGLRSLLCKLYT